MVNPSQLRINLILTVCTIPFLAGGCIYESPKAISEKELKNQTVEKQETTFENAIAKVAVDYKKLTLVDDSPRLAPTTCRGPRPITFESKSTDAETHGKKIYYLYAKNLDVYRKLDESPVGQSLVKESFPVPKSDNAIPGVGGKSSSIFPDTNNPKELFIMTKLEASVKGTDNGWIYGTVDPKTMKVTSSGVLENCSGCHQDAGKDRLFGLKNAKEYSPFAS